MEKLPEGFQIGFLSFFFPSFLFEMMARVLLVTRWPTSKDLLESGLFLEIDRGGKPGRFWRKTRFFLFILTPV